MTLTFDQRAVLDFIRDHTSEQGRSPSIRKIAEHRGIKSVSRAFEIVRSLELAGAIRVHRAGRSSWIEVLVGSKLPLDLGSLEPLVRRAAAKAGVTPESFVLTAVRERLASFGLRTVPRETPSELRP